MKALYLLSVWVHVVSAIVWIGGSLFLALILVPALRRSEHRGLAAGIVGWIGRLNLLLALVVVWLGMMLVRGGF